MPDVGGPQIVDDRGDTMELGHCTTVPLPPPPPTTGFVKDGRAFGGGGVSSSSSAKGLWGRRGQRRYVWLLRGGTLGHWGGSGVVCAPRLKAVHEV